MKTRAKLARERAGLSIGQACEYLKLERTALVAIEESDEAFWSADPIVRDVWMLDVYGVNREWLTGERPQHDYAAVNGIRGAENISDHDRDIVAEFAAAMPRREPTWEPPGGLRRPSKTYKHGRRAR